jgi:hypothetical protein
MSSHGERSITSLAGRIRRSLFGISTREAGFERRGFHSSDNTKREHLERIGQSFIHGYNTALTCAHRDQLTAELLNVENEWRGFAYEGAAMALQLLDFVTPWNRDRWRQFIDGAGRQHVYMVHVGAGWAISRLHRDITSSLRRFDEVLGWLVVDGFGFHEGYFHPDRTITQHLRPRACTGYAARVFDQGVGRSMWFAHGADVDRIVVSVNSFDEKRRADLLTGVGLAAAYAGGASTAELVTLQTEAELYRKELAQGAAFAAKARLLAGTMTPHTETGCGILCGMSAADAASVTDQAFVNLSTAGDLPKYEIWRQRIQAEFAMSRVPS